MHLPANLRCDADFPKYTFHSSSGGAGNGKTNASYGIWNIGDDFANSSDIIFYEPHRI